MTSLHGERATNTSAAGGPGQPTATIRHWTGWPPVPPGRRSPLCGDACRGYVIAAMERCDFKPSDIEQVMVELYEVFDYTTLQEAEAYYERSPY